MVFFGLYSAFLHLQTQRVESMPKSSVLVSSDHSAFSQAFSESFRFSRQTVNRPVHVPSCVRKTWRFRSKSITVWCVSTRILGDCGLNCLQITNKLLPCNFGIQRLSHDQPHCTSKDLAWSKIKLCVSLCCVSLCVARVAYLYRRLHNQNCVSTTFHKNTSSLQYLFSFISTCFQKLPAGGLSMTLALKSRLNSVDSCCAHSLRTWWREDN